MRKIFFVILTSVLFSKLLFGQYSAEYEQLVQEAWSNYETKAYLASGQKYAAAFALEGIGTVNDRYNAACSWALAGEADSSFIQLLKIARKAKYANLKHISTDPDLISIHEDPRWDEVIKLVTANKEEVEKDFDKPLVALLDSIYDLDQGYRRQIKEIDEKFGWDSKEMQAHWDLIDYTDSINLEKVKQILDERGWLGPQIIGGKGNQTLFLVIQHADLETQEKYLPVMREAVANNNANPSSLALLEDRVALRKGEKQIYGSQVGRDEDGTYYVLPLIDPDHVDERRQEVGLGSIQDYISNWGLTWDVEEYKKMLPEYEAKEKE